MYHVSLRCLYFDLINSPQSEDSPKWEPGNSADLEMAQ